MPEMTLDEKKAQFAKKTPAWLGGAVGLPNAAALYVLCLERRILELEERVAQLQGPPHLASVEKRA
jgi:hypothetical protein